MSCVPPPSRTCCAARARLRRTSAQAAIAAAATATTAEPRASQPATPEDIRWLVGGWRASSSGSARTADQPSGNESKGHRVGGGVVADVGLALHRLHLDLQRRLLGELHDLAEVAERDR